MCGRYTLTTPADDLLAVFRVSEIGFVPGLRDLHSRMPVLLDEGARQVWLDPEREVGELEEVLATPPASELELHPVSTLINSPHNDSPECIRPAEEPRR